jgi:hypothetical protein
MIDCHRNHSGSVSGFRDVAGNPERRGTESPGESGCAGFIPDIDRNLGAQFEQSLSSSAPQSAGRTGDQYHPAAEILVHTDKMGSGTGEPKRR